MGTFSGAKVRIVNLIYTIHRQASYSITGTLWSFFFLDILSQPQQVSSYTKISGNSILCELNIPKLFTKGWMPPTGQQLARNFDGYVILVDFEPILNCSYQRSVQEIIPSVGLFVSNVIRNFNFNPRKIELIGHSLGGHLAGYIGASLNGAIKRITG